MTNDVRISCAALVAAALIVGATPAGVRAQQTTAPPAESAQSPALTAPPDKAADKKKDDQGDDDNRPEKARRVGRLRISMDGHEEPVTGSFHVENDFPRALQVCVLNKVPAEDKRVIEETFDHHVGPLGRS